MKKIKSFFALTLFIASLLGCSKNDETIEPTNVGEINFEGKVALTVTESNISGYELIGVGKYLNRTVTIKMLFPSKPIAGDYTPIDDNITVSFQPSSNIYFLSDEQVIRVTTNGKTLKASFTKAEFAGGNTSLYYTGYLQINQ